MTDSLAATVHTGQPAAEAPVTMVLTRKVKRGHGQAFEAAVERLIAAASAYPGYLGATVERPAPGGRSYRIVVFFTSEAARRAWMGARERLAHLAELAPHVAGRDRVRVALGQSAWLAPPDGGPGEGDAPRYKLALLRWAAVFPLVTGLNWLLAPVLSGQPVPVQTFVLSVILIVVTTWLVMPRLTRLCAGWLFAGR